MDYFLRLSNLNSLLAHLREKSQMSTAIRRSLPTLPEESRITDARLSLPLALAEGGDEKWAEHLVECIVPGLNASSLSPNYYGFVTGGCTPPALFADMLVSVYDQNVQIHLPHQTVATNVEACALGMLLDLFRLDRNVWGTAPTFTTGATASNILGLVMGREWVLRQKGKDKTSPQLRVNENGIHEVMESVGIKKIQILSTMPHSCIAKAASIVGVGRANVISVSRLNELGDATLEIDFDRLEEEARRIDVANILVISAGEVNTGRFATRGLETMVRLRSICDNCGIWIHVDAAFGLFARILASPGDVEFDEIVRGCQGLELADSIAGDGHKLLNVPYDCGFHFCQHKEIAEDVFRNSSATYLASAVPDDGITSPLNVGIENSRRFRALPVYATLLAFGREGYVNMLKRQIRLARMVTADLWESKTYQVLPAAISKAKAIEQTFIVVLFRAQDASLNIDLVRRINATRKIYVSGTVWKGRPAVRFAIAKWDVNVERDREIISEVLNEVGEC